MTDIESKIRDVLQEETEQRDRQIRDIVGTVAKAVGKELTRALFEAPGARSQYCFDLIA